jgi:hypothetical protein
MLIKGSCTIGVVTECLNLKETIKVNCVNQLMSDLR